MFHVIKEIAANADNYSIQITYDDDVTVNADFSEIVEKGIMTVLKTPTVFNQVEIGHRGRSIIWTKYDIDFCADSLRFSNTKNLNEEK